MRVCLFLEFNYKEKVQYNLLYCVSFSTIKILLLLLLLDMLSPCSHANIAYISKCIGQTLDYSYLGLFQVGTIFQNYPKALRVANT